MFERISVPLDWSSRGEYYVPHLLSADRALSGYENLLVFASNAIYPIAIMPASQRRVTA
jgi:hypothetical protein